MSGSLPMAEACACACAARCEPPGQTPPRSIRGRVRAGPPDLPALLLMAVDFGRLFFTYIQVSNAAREAAAYGAAQPTDTVGMQARAVQEKNSQTQGEGPLDPIATSCANQAGTDDRLCGGTGRRRRRQHPDRHGPPAVHLPHPADQRHVRRRASGCRRRSRRPCSCPRRAGRAGARAPALGRRTPRSRSSPPDFEIIANPDGSKPDTGVCTISGYNWDFGDGETDVGSSIPVTHTYAVARHVCRHARGHEPGWHPHGDPHRDRSACRRRHRPRPRGPTPTPTSGPTPTPTRHRHRHPPRRRAPTRSPNFSWTVGQSAAEHHVHRPLVGAGRLPDHDLALGFRRRLPVEQRAQSVP